MLKIGKKALSGGEYALLLGVVSLALVAGFETFTGQMTDTFDKLKAKLEIISAETLADGSDNVVTLPDFLDPASPPSTVSYLYNASKAPTSYSYPNSLLTYWQGLDAFGGSLNRLDLTPESVFPNINYNIGIDPSMNCIGAVLDYCYFGLMGGSISDSDYDGRAISIIGDRVAFVQSRTALTAMLTNPAVDTISIDNFASSLYFMPCFGTGCSSVVKDFNYSIDGNNGAVGIFYPGGQYRSYELADGVFDIAKPICGYQTWGDPISCSLYDWFATGYYQYKPAENSVVNVYYEGRYDTPQTHLINMENVLSWNSNCYSIDGRDVVKVTNPDNNYSAVFNFFRTPTFSEALGASCDFSDANTFVQ